MIHALRQPVVWAPRLAVQYQMAEQEMASILFFSTIFSVITMGGFI
jgi:predicted permease